MQSCLSAIFCTYMAQSAILDLLDFDLRSILQGYTEGVNQTTLLGPNLQILTLGAGSKMIQVLISEIRKSLLNLGGSM